MSGEPGESPGESGASTGESGASTVVGVRILDTEYRVRCREDEVDALRDSARDLDARMLRAREVGKSLGVDRIAVIAALNLARENLDLQRRIDAASRELAQLSDRVDDALGAYAVDAPDAP